MNKELKGRFNEKIIEFNSRFPIENISKLNLDDAVDHFFGCCEDSFGLMYEDSLIYHLKRDFIIIDQEERKYDTTLGLTYVEKDDMYMHFESKPFPDRQKKKFDFSYAKNMASGLLKIIRDYRSIIEMIDYCESEKCKMTYSDIDLFKEKIKNSKPYMTYGMRKLLAIYFPYHLLPFISEEEISIFFDEYEVGYSNDDLERLVLINNYCNRNDLNTFDIAYEFHNYAAKRKYILNFGETYKSESELLSYLKSGQLNIKLNQIKNNFANFGNIHYLEGREVYISYKDKVIYKSMLKKAEFESNKTIVLRFLNLAEVNEKYKRVNDNLIEYIKKNFISDYKELFSKNIKLEILFNLIKDLKPIKCFTIVKGKTKCHSQNHVQTVTKVNILVIDKSDVSIIQSNASYCKNCDRYTIHIEDFRELERKCFVGNIVADVTNDSHEHIDFGSQYSYLYHIGYNVSQKSDLSREIRRTYLDYMLDFEWSREKLISHLNTEISKRKNLPNMSRAISVWREDLEYVKNRVIYSSPNPNFYVHYLER